MKLAVYGSLLKGLHNHSLIAHLTQVATGITKGRMVSLGGFPGVFFGGDTTVKVEVYEIDPETLKRVDSLEGYSPNREDDTNFYNRKTVEVETPLGVIECLSYELGKSYEGRTMSNVPDGDWRKYVVERPARY